MRPASPITWPFTTVQARRKLSAPSLKYRGRSRRRGQGHGVDVERRFSNAPLQFAASERPGKGLTE